MLIIGLLLLAAAVTVGIDVAYLNQSAIDIEAFGQTYTTNPAVVLAVGAVCGIVACLGIMMMRDGWVRGHYRRRGRRAERTRREELADERQRQIDRESELSGGRTDVRDRDDIDLRDRDTRTGTYNDEYADEGERVERR